MSSPSSSPLSAEKKGLKRKKKKEEEEEEEERRGRGDEEEDEEGRGGDGKKGLLPIKLAKKAEKPPVRRPVSSVFGNDSSDEDEEMPAEAKMRMRNVGRDTVTSSGPNSFGKTKRGFCDSKKLFEKQLQEAMDKVSGD